MPEARARYPELKITVLNDGTVHAVTETPWALADDGKIYEDELLREMLATFRDWLNWGKLKIVNERELILLGKLLHRLLFGAGGPKITHLIYKTMQEAKDSAKPIRLQLEFIGKQAELASLPWEFLCDPKSGSFFAMANELILTRFVNGCEGRQTLLSNKLPLRMLIVVSKRGGKSVAAADVVTAIQAFANAHPDQITLDKPLIDPTLLELQTWLENEENRPQIIHFIGHGQYNKSENWGEIALAKTDESDEAEWVDQNRFKHMLANSGCIPRLLFLQLCEGARVQKGELIASFEGLAPVLIEANVQAVVAMQFPISNLHAGKISTRFYEELTKGRSVGEAVTAARRMAWTIDPVAGGTPVLYMYGYDGAIVSTSSSGTYVGGYAGVAGGPPSGLEPGQPAARPSDIPESISISNLPVSGQLSDVLSAVLAAGDREIAKLREGILDKELPDEIMALNKKLNFEVIQALRGKKNTSDIKQSLADFYQSEADTQLRQVLGAMYETAVRMA